MEAECAISNMDFIFKIHIALKECSETLYWLDSLKDTFFVTEEMHAGIYRDGEAKPLHVQQKIAPNQEELSTLPPQAFLLDRGKRLPYSFRGIQAFRILWQFQITS